MKKKAPHAHHWIIEPDAVRNAHGYCKTCPARRTFKGIPDDYKDYFRESHTLTYSQEKNPIPPEVRRAFRWSTDGE